MKKSFYVRKIQLSNYKNKKMACLCGERPSSSISLSIFVVLSILSLPSKAYAYFDPGTGSMILQGLIAGLMGLLFTIKTYWTRIKNFLFRSKIDERKKAGKDE